MKLPPCMRQQILSPHKPQKSSWWECRSFLFFCSHRRWKTLLIDWHWEFQRVPAFITDSMRLDDQPKCNASRSHPQHNGVWWLRPVGNKIWSQGTQTLFLSFRVIKKWIKKNAGPKWDRWTAQYSSTMTATRLRSNVAEERGQPNSLEERKKRCPSESRKVAADTNKGRPCELTERLYEIIKKTF